MAIAMAYGFVAYEDTVEYKMEQWYKTEKDCMPHQANTKKSPNKEVTKYSSKTKADPVRHYEHTTHQNTPDDDQQMRSRRSSQLATSLNSQLDDIPEDSEEQQYN